ncbi:MAG: TFIIB-type zinc ribbon-containing protein [Thermoplasmatales archaeon]|nr:MAG: TFIIB-type zinc ribbon-containing protein [Thermoplasmatales archaeon]
MGNSRRGVDKKLLLSCPYCTRDKVVKNEHHHKGKLQFFCTACHKYFYEDSAKGYPPTSIPFPIIAYLLYFRRKIPEFSNMRKFREFVNHWLQYLNINDRDVSRQTIHHWIKHYEKDFDRIITFSEARDFCDQLLSQITKTLPILSQKPVSYWRALKILENKFGKTYCIDLIRKDEIFFKEFCNIINKHDVFCWEFLDRNSLERSRKQRSFPAG